jgi:tetratricopeptide (TPR) repeat protein
MLNSPVSTIPANKKAEELLRLAIKDFKKITMELDSEHDKAFGCMGLCYGLLRNYEQAICNYNEAIKLNKTLASHYHNRGWVYLKKKEYGLARQDLNKVLEIDPNIREAKLLLEQIEKECNEK